MFKFPFFRQVIVEQPDDDISHLLGGNPQQQDNQPQQDQNDKQSSVQPDDIGNLLGDSGEEQQSDGEKELDQIVDQAASQDPDKQGVIRTVKNAHLVYKRQGEDGTYSELWVYNVGKLQDELDIRKAILSGTDIPEGKNSSPDNQQKYEIWSAGNAEVLHIVGLPN